MKRGTRKRKASGSSGGSWGQASQTTSKPPKEYIVERILDRRQRNGVTEYLLKWHGYSNTHNSWEPEENILSQKMLDDFNEWYEEQQAHRHHVIKSPQSTSDLSNTTSSSGSSSMMIGNESNGRGSSSSIENALNYNRANAIARSSSDQVQNANGFASNEAANCVDALERAKLNIRNLTHKALLPHNSADARNRSRAAVANVVVRADAFRSHSAVGTASGSANGVNRWNEASNRSNIDLNNNNRSLANLANLEANEPGRQLSVGRKRQTCIDLNLPVEKIYGATKNSNGDLFYLVKWKNCSGTELVHSRIMEDRQPHAVLDFFHSHCRFK